MRLLGPWAGGAGEHVFRSMLAVAGRNARMEATLRAAAVQRPRIRAFGYTDRVPALMAAADLVITSPGDTFAEARAAGRRLLDVLPGHGRDNCQHQLERGNAWVTSGWPRRRGAHRLRRAGGTGTGSGGPGRHDRPGTRPARLGRGLLRCTGRAGFRPSAAGPLAARFAACILPAAPPTY